MAVQRWGDPHLDIPVDLAQLFHNGRQVALQMDSQRQEIRHHQDAGHARIRQMRHRFRQAGPSLQKGCFYAIKRSRGGRRFRHESYSFVGGWDAGTVRKDDNSRIHR